MRFKIPVSKRFKLWSGYWTPANMNTAVWFDASDTDSIIESGGSVSQWNDKSGNTNNAIQGTGSIQPETGGDIGGLNALTLDGTKWMDFTKCGLSDDAMVIFVYAPNDTGYSVLGSSLGVTDNDNWDIYDNDGLSYPDHFIVDRFTSLALSVPVTGEHMLAYMADVPNTEYQLRLDGTEIFTSSTTKVFADNIDLIGRGGGSRTPLIGEIGEIVIVDNYSDSDIEKLEGYLAWKWGLTGNLPNDHPYKNGAPTI